MSNDTHVDGTYCRDCGASLASGYSWDGFCVACAEPHVLASQGAEERLAEAVAALAEAGPLHNAKVVNLRVKHGDGYTNVQAVIFTESADLGKIMAARLGEPTTAERAGIPPHPFLLDEAQFLLQGGAGLEVLK